jgi:hypothetical protein
MKIEINKQEANTTEEVSLVVSSVEFKDKVPSNWVIEIVDGTEDSILARNNKTLETFQGTIEEFNKALK